MKNHNNADIYDFSDYAEEITGDALFKINGGAEVENSHEGVAGAKPGDTITRKNGDVIVLKQADIDYAKAQLGNNGNDGTGNTNGNSGTGNNSNSGSNNTSNSRSTNNSSSGANNTGISNTSTSESTPEVSEEIKQNSDAYANYMSLQGRAKDEGESGRYKGYNVLGVEIQSKDIVVNTVNDEKKASSNEIILSNKVYQFGIGAGIFLLGGLSAEIGVVYSEKEGFDLYVTGGIGVGVGISGDITIGASWSDLENKTLHNSTSNKAVIGAFANTTYDLNKNAKIDGVGGFGFGGGVLWTGTRTLKGSCQEIVNIVNSVADLF